MYRIQAKEYNKLILKEQDICKLFVYYFRLEQQLGLIPPSVRLIKSVSEGKRSLSFASQLKAQGWQAGIPDYSVQFAGGLCIYIEFKRSSKGKLTAAQAEFKQWCDDNNVPHLLTSCHNEAINFIKSQISN
jgi:hypothetical protein